MTSKKVIQTYLLVSGLYTLSASLIWGVNTLFLMDAGLSIFEVFIANGVFTASMAIFEIPTGVLADTRGRRVSFLLSVAVLVVGTLGYVGAARIGGGVVLFSLMSVILGLGFTFYSGAVEAWLVDALISTGYDAPLEQVFSRGSMVSGAAMLVGTVGGGLLGDLNLALPFLGRALFLAIVFGIALFKMQEIGYVPRALKMAALPQEMNKVMRDSLRYGWDQKSVRLFMVMGFIQMGVSGWVFYAWQPYFLELLGRDAVWVAGVVAALIALSTIAGNAVVGWLSRFCLKRTTLLVASAGLFTAAITGIGLVHSFWAAVALLMLVMFAAGVAQPVRQAYFNHLIPSEQRATIISFDSMVSSAGGAIGQTGLGYLAQVRSIAGGYVVGGLFTVLALPVVLLLRRRNDPVDQMDAGPGCAGQGLPEVSQMDADAGQPLPGGVLD